MICALTLLPLGAGAFTPPFVSSDFESGLDGWTRVTQSGGVPSDSSVLSHEASGGNPGGYMRFDDGSGGDYSFVAAPAKFLGDWSSLDGTGVLSWDHRVFAVGGGDLIDCEVRIEGPGGVAVFNVPHPDEILTHWITATAPIDQAEWAVESGSWNAILADVTNLRIAIEVIDNNVSIGEITGIDNVVLSDLQTVPALGPLGLGLAGAAVAATGVLATRRRSRHRN